MWVDGRQDSRLELFHLYMFTLSATYLSIIVSVAQIGIFLAVTLSNYCESDKYFSSTYGCLVAIGILTILQTIPRVLETRLLHKLMVMLDAGLKCSYQNLYFLIDKLFGFVLLIVHIVVYSFLPVPSYNSCTWHVAVWRDVTLASFCLTLGPMTILSLWVAKGSMTLTIRSQYLGQQSITAAAMVQPTIAEEENGQHQQQQPVSSTTTATPQFSERLEAGSLSLAAQERIPFFVWDAENALCKKSEPGLVRRKNRIVNTTANQTNHNNAKCKTSNDECAKFSCMYANWGEVRDAGHESCLICIEDFELGDVVSVIPVCGHAFHQKCLQEWFSMHNECVMRCHVNLETGLPIGINKDVNDGDGVVQLDQEQPQLLSSTDHPTLQTPTGTMHQHLVSPNDGNHEPQLQEMAQDELEQQQSQNQPHDVEASQTLHETELDNPSVVVVPVSPTHHTRPSSPARSEGLVASFSPNEPAMLDGSNHNNYVLRLEQSPNTEAVMQMVSGVHLKMDRVQDAQKCVFEQSDEYTKDEHSDHYSLLASGQYETDEKNEKSELNTTPVHINVVHNDSENTSVHINPNNHSNTNPSPIRHDQGMLIQNERFDVVSDAFPSSSNDMNNVNNFNVPHFNNSNVLILNNRPINSASTVINSPVRRNRANSISEAVMSPTAPQSKIQRKGKDSGNVNDQHH